MSYGCNLLLFLFSSLGILAVLNIIFRAIRRETINDSIVSGNTQLHWHDRLKTEEIPVKKHFWVPIQYFMDYAHSAVSAYHCELI